MFKWIVAFSKEEEEGSYLLTVGVPFEKEEEKIGRVFIDWSGKNRAFLLE